MQERIKAIRKDLGLTQQEFADRMGMERGTYSLYEIGKNTPSQTAIALICRTYNIDEVWLRTGAGEMFSPRTQEDEITSFVGRILGSGGTEFQRDFVAVLATLGPDEWELIRQMVAKLSESAKKDPAE